jgi:hypothetical protein
VAVQQKAAIVQYNWVNIRLDVLATVTDNVEGVCVDPGEKEAILEAGGPGPPGGEKGGQLASDSGGG